MDLSVKLQVPLGVEGEISYSWTLQVCYEVSQILWFSKSSNGYPVLGRLITFLDRLSLLNLDVDDTCRRFAMK